MAATFADREQLNIIGAGFFKGNFGILFIRYYVFSGQA